MNTKQQTQIKSTLEGLHRDSQNDFMRMASGMARSIFRPLQPSDMKDAYLAISAQQGDDLVHLITTRGLKNIVEFGTSFGVSTLYLAQGVLVTGGKIVTTELIKSKADKARQNFVQAGVSDLIEIRVGDALVSLDGYQEPIDLLLLDGWKNLYLPIFRLLEQNFHSNSLIYVDNADMGDSQHFLQTISHDPKYKTECQYGGKVALVSLV